jgi:hypothetical protein
VCQCKSGFVEKIDGNGCTCPVGTFLNEESCTDCDPRCVVCSALNSCTACVSNSAKVGSICKCDEGYRYDSTATNPCVPCHDGAIQDQGDETVCKCKKTHKRIDESTCQACPDHSIQSDTDASLCVCKTGFERATENDPCLCISTTFFNSTSSRCDSIPINCERNQTDHFVLFGASGYYYDNLNEKCEPCAGTCITCSSASVCTSCIDNASIDFSQGCSCDLRYVFNEQTKVCDYTCPDSCVTCSEEDGHVCSACTSGSVFWSEVTGCYSSCPTGYTANQFTNTCEVGNTAIFSSEFSNKLLYRTSNGFTLTGNAVTPAYQRGWYYDGAASATLSNNILLGTVFNFEFWIRFDDLAVPNVIFSKESAGHSISLHTVNGALTLSTATESFDKYYRPATSTVSMSIVTSLQWVKI